jgi:hypothetical protein
MCHDSTYAVHHFHGTFTSSTADTLPEDAVALRVADELPEDEPAAPWRQGQQRRRPLGLGPLLA